MDLRPLLRPRHLTLTVLVGLLAGATLAAAAIDVDPDVPAALSSAVAFPPRAEGDRGEYAIWDDDVPTDPDAAKWRAPDWTFEFWWGADELHLDADGQLVWTNVLHTKNTYIVDGLPVEANRTEFISAGGLRHVASDYTSTDNHRQDGTGILPTSSTASSQKSRTVFYRVDPFREGDPCLHLPTQGTSLQLNDATIDGFGHCRWITNNYDDDANVKVRAVGGRLGEREVLLEAHVTDLPFEELIGRMWLREGLAYPARLEMVMDYGPPYSLAVLRRFDAGTTPLRTDDAASPGLPPLQMADRQPWGPDETGIAHDFPLSAAFAAARDDPEYDGLRRLLEAHPDAYVAAATYAAFDMATRDQQRWNLGVTDGTTVLSLEVVRSVPDPLSEGAVVAAVQGTSGPSITVYADDWYAGLLPLPAAEVPAQLPTVASLFEHWVAYAADVGSLPVPANAWGFQLAQDPDGPESLTGFLFDAGHISYTETQTVPTNLGQFGPGSYGWKTSRIAWQESLEHVRVFSQGNSTGTEEEATLPAAAAQPAPAMPVAGGSEGTQVAASRRLFEFTPLERATIGVGALLVAGLYWLAPLAKNALVGLFSRIRDDELLRNPSRLLLRDLVAENPGIHHQELVRRLGKGKGGAEHHLRKLVEGGVLVSRPSPGYTCYWLPGQATRVSVAAAPALKSPIAQGIVRLRQQNPGISSADMARALAVRPATISYHVERLRAAGVLTATGQAMPGFVDAAGEPATAA